jgi:hypothetical protein
MLKWRQRKQARYLARRAWIEGGNDCEAAEVLFRSDCESQGIDPATLLLLLQLAIQLWMWWRDHNQSEPSTIPVFGEPGFTDQELDSDD